MGFFSVNGSRCKTSSRAFIKVEVSKEQCLQHAVCCDDLYDVLSSFLLKQRTLSEYVETTVRFTCNFHDACKRWKLAFQWSQGSPFQSILVKKHGVIP